MCSALRPYLGEVLGIYRYGSVSGKHESYKYAETVDGYLSLRVYEQHLRRRLWMGVLAGSQCRILLDTDATKNSDNEDEDDYEEPDEAMGTKKWRLKASRGAAKTQKTDDWAAKEKSQKRTKPRRKKAVAAKRGVKSNECCIRSVGITDNVLEVRSRQSSTCGGP
ncbi:hypothetical protein B0H14DRAFT_2558467 [Mycena olivaceomarginata]|nr:hypothetical protein B0H14DRAFT_2558467 [Mycena olivaceomarginata]